MNVEQLRTMLANQMVLLEKKKGDPKTANAMVNAAGKILASVKLELEYAKRLGIPPSVAFITTKAPPKVQAKARKQLKAA